MPRHKLEIGDIYKNVDDAVLNRASAALVNGYRDEFGAIHKTPGLSEFIDLGLNSRIDGIYWWDEKRKAVVVCDNKAYIIETSSGDYTQFSLASGVLAPSGRITFATDGSYLFLAGGGGGALCYVDPADNTVKRVVDADADAPSNSSSVVFLDSYIIANDLDSGTIVWSDPLTPLVWQGTSYATPETKPDDLLGVFTGWRELLLVGRETIEVWFNDGSTPFSRLEGAHTEDGCIAIHTFRQLKNGWIWLNRNRQFVTMAGRIPQVISTPFDKYIQSLPRVDDAEAEIIDILGQTLYIVSFPAANKTIVYNHSTNSWSEWGEWNSADCDYDRYRGVCAAYCKDWNIHLIGDKETGKIYRMSPSYTSNDGDTIRFLLRTGNMDMGSTAQKRCNGLFIRAKRGTGTASNSPPLMVRFRDDGGVWGNELWPSLGYIGDTEFFIELRRLGMFRTRQYELTHSDNSELIVVGVEEDVTPLIGR